jgi:hypothetical protein
LFAIARVAAGACTVVASLLSAWAFTAVPSIISASLSGTAPALIAFPAIITASFRSSLSSIILITAWALVTASGDVFLDGVDLREILLLGELSPAEGLSHKLP